MSKFNVGELVKVIADDHSEKGQRGTVECVDKMPEGTDYAHYSCISLDGKHHFGASEDQLLLVVPKRTKAEKAKKVAETHGR